MALILGNVYPLYDSPSDYQALGSILLLTENLPRDSGTEGALARLKQTLLAVTGHRPEVLVGGGLGNKLFCTPATMLIFVRMLNNASPGLFLSPFTLLQ